MRALSTWPSCQRAETFECMHETDCLRPVCNAVSVRPQNILIQAAVYYSAITGLTSAWHITGLTSAWHYLMTRQRCNKNVLLLVRSLRTLPNVRNRTIHAQKPLNNGANPRTWLNTRCALISKMPKSSGHADMNSVVHGTGVLGGARTSAPLLKRILGGLGGSGPPKFVSWTSHSPQPTLLPLSDISVGRHTVCPGCCQNDRNCVRLAKVSQCHGHHQPALQCIGLSDRVSPDWGHLLDMSTPAGASPQIWHSLVAH